MELNKYTFIDLFAGAGGLSEGFIVNGNFHPVAHVEMNIDACNTLKTRQCYRYFKEKSDLCVYRKYLKGEISREELYRLVPNELLEATINAEITEDSLPSLFEKIRDRLQSDQLKQVDLVIGGPPCQAYSLVGRSVSSTQMRTDPRNYLYKLYVQFLREYQPKVFVFENVPGILTAHNGKIIKMMVDEINDVGYDVEYRVLNACDFGVLQNRRRVIIVGWRKNLELCYPSLEACKIELDAEVFDILSDLTPLKRGEERNEYITEPNKYLKTVGMREDDDVLTHHVCRNHNEKDVEIYRRVILAWNECRTRMKYTDLPDKLKTHKNSTAFLDRYKVLAGNIKCSHTMIAHIAKDGHHFIHPDVNQCRSISVREAARIQSFPDSYYFEGSRASKFVQIGNAVPPLMAKGIAEGIQRMLEGIRIEKTI